MQKFKGVVVQVFADSIVIAAGGVEYILPQDELLGSSQESRQENLKSFASGQEHEVALVSSDPIACADGFSRPAVSTWLVERARREAERNAILQAVQVWSKKGNGFGRVIEVQAERGFCLVQPEGESFVALLHVKDMFGGQENLQVNNARLSGELKPGDRLPVALKEEPRVKKFRPAIRLIELGLEPAENNGL